MKEALLYEKLKDRKIRCNICQRRCLIKNGERGFCYTRLNQDGKLYSLAYGRVSTIAIAPIEKKPLFHFYPGSRWLSLGSLGCNFRCPGCQNWEIAHAKISIEEEKGVRTTEYLSCEDAIRIAKEERCIGLSFTYNEPTVNFEYTLDCSKLAKKNKLLTNYVTNGFITKEALDEIGPFLDAFRVDIKGFSEKFYKKIANIADFRGILDVTKYAKYKWKMHVEIVTNIIPGFSDDDMQLRGIASWIKDELGSDTPWHVTQFVPHLKLSHLSFTSVATLERARRIGFDSGLHYVYLGNIPGHPAENTYCHNCHKLLIEREDFVIRQFNIVEGKCPGCKEPILGKLEYEI